jgi:hypothetical protein
MNTVVMIAYCFPPEGNAGSYRPLRFVRGLPRLHWKAAVVSALPSQYERYDPELLNAVPEKTEVVRVKGYDLWQAFQSWRSRKITNRNQSSSAVSGATFENNKKESAILRSLLRRLARAAEAWWYHPDMAAPWIQPAVDAAVKLCRRESVRVIWATAGPVSAFHVAKRASQQTGIPYVLDFRDSWTITHNDFEAARPKWAIRYDRKCMFELLKDAQAVIFRYASEVECYLRAYKGALDPLRIHIIPNGYEGAIEESVIPTGDRCQILYTGTLRSYRYDSLFESLRNLKAVEPGKAKHLRLVFVGETPTGLSERLNEMGLSDIVELRAATSHAEITRLQREAHGFLVLGRSPEMRGHELLVGAKLFEYLKRGRPILGVLPSDETKSILRRLEVKTIADVDSASEISALFLNVLEAWSSNQLSVLRPDRKRCEHYSADVQAAALARALEGKQSLETFVPGSAKIPSSLSAFIEKENWLH